MSRVRAVLQAVVEDHGRDPANPWAIGHAMLALGPDLVLTNDQPAIDWLFAEYADVQKVGDQVGLSFPTKKGPVRVEPHTDLLLKALTETGVSPDREVVVGGETFTVSQLYGRSLCAAWIDGERTAFGSWNDAPWALQGLSHWAPNDLAWTSDGNHAMTLDAWTHATVQKLTHETSFMRDAMGAGTVVQKRGQGIFAYTCGGAHLLQGATWAVGRGFGEDSDRAAIAQEVSVLIWRLDVELSTVDAALAQHPDYTVILLDQRMKFLGHFLESVHKAAAIGLFNPTDDEKVVIARAEQELIVTVDAIVEKGIIKELKKLQSANEQAYLDYVGDAAHALRGIDLHTGVGEVRF
ncbi:MAG: hypothetical protein GWP91_03700 [Rhodobacterales bacterium]|nr:hypothetical protein [Rhodobacterales bacterium]